MAQRKGPPQVGDKVNVGLDPQVAIIVRIDSANSLTVTWDASNPTDRWQWETVPFEQITRL